MESAVIERVEWLEIMGVLGDIRASLWELLDRLEEDDGEGEEADG